MGLIRSKSLPPLLFGTELRSLNSTVPRVLMKLFRTNSAEIIEERRDYFNFPTCDCLVNLRTSIFLEKYCVLTSILCASLVDDDAKRHLATLTHLITSLVYFFFRCATVFGEIKM